MTKGDFPALRMVIEGGRLAPAGPFDQERLNSYRRGTVVYVRFTEEKDRVLVRKWFAIISLVLKTCETPWKNKDEAHEAIKLALGIVNLSKTVGGQFMQYPKSLSELEDPELQEALEQMTALLSRMTGVDVETLRKETAHIAETVDHDPQTGEIIEHEITESGASPSPDATEAAPPLVAEPDEPPPSSGSLSPSDLEWLTTVARMLWSATHWTGNADENLALLNNQRIACNALDASPSLLARDKAGSIYRACKNAVLSNIYPPEALELIATHAGCTEQQITQIGGGNG